jgi:hypothetical protein
VNRRRLYRNAIQLIVALSLFLLALGPRAFGLDVFITADERRWIERSVQFFSALSIGDFADTFQSGHPGVTTKWTGTVGLLVKYLSQARQPSFAGLRAFLDAVPVHPSVSVEYLPVMRFPTVLLASACVVAVYFMVRRVFGDRVALLSGVLLALDPFYLAHSRVLHHDALATTFMTLAVLGFLICAWHGRWRTFLVLSGLAAGLSFLSKGPALFLAPFVGLLCGIGYLAQVEARPARPERSRREPRRRDWLKIERGALVRWASAWLGWAAVALLIFFLLWPVTWVEPVSAIRGLFDKAIGYAGEAHTKGNFFLGRAVDNPGPLFYPVTFLFRMTPLTLLGLVAAFFFWIKEQTVQDTALEGSHLQRLIDLLLGKGEERETRSRQLSLLSLWAYLFAFVLFMTLGDKKFDRYILPVYPIVEILAALGLCQLLETLGRLGNSFQATSVFAHRESSCGQGYSQPSPGWLWALGLAVCVFLQAGFTLPHYPYYLTYYNPLVGGSWLAPKAYYVGWGEGLDQMARYLNQEPGAARLKVSSWYQRELLPFFLGSANGLDAEGDANLMPWHTADYVVFYLNQVQRENPSQALVSYIRSLEPEHVVRLKGIDYAWLYRTPEYIPDEVVPAQHVQRAWFGDDLALLGYDVDGSQVPFDSPSTGLRTELGTPPPDGKVRVNLYWQGLREMEADYRIFLDLVNGVYHVWGKQDGRPYWDSYPTNRWPKGLVLRDVREIEVWPGTPPGYYQVAISVYDPASGRWLPPEGGGDLIIGPVELPRREPPSVEALDIEHPLSIHLDDRVRLLGYNITGAFQPGSEVHLTLFWQALKAMDEDYTVFIHLTDPQGHVWGQKDNPPVDGFYPTTAWEVGEIVRDQYEVPISPETPPGTYYVVTGMYLVESGQRLSVVDEGGKVVDDRIMLIEVQITP